LLDYYRQTSGNKKKSCKKNCQRTAAREAAAMLLDRLHSPHG
jgi:hypothetical protein